MSNEFDSIEEVEETLYQLIDLGLVEVYGVDEDGEFIYGITNKEMEDE